MLYHHRLFQKIKEEVFNKESNARIKNFQINLEVEKSEKESQIIHQNGIRMELLLDFRKKHIILPKQFLSRREMYSCLLPMGCPKQ